METKKTELPSEIRINENKNNRQLRSIVLTTKRWLDLLFHECNGLMSNVNWITKAMGEDMPEQELPEAVFRELNQTNRKSIYTLKEIQQYINILHVVADKDKETTDSIILSKSLLTTLVPELAAGNISVNDPQLEVSKDFAHVLSFLLQKLMDHIAVPLTTDRQFNLYLEPRQDNLLFVQMASSTVFWHHDFWDKHPFETGAPLSLHPEDWPKLMFYELLTLVGGKVLSGCNELRDFTFRDRRPKLASELIAQEIGGQYLSFCIPLNL